MIFFGFDHEENHDIKAPANTDGVLCPQCNHILHYHFITYGNLGSYFCPNCGFERPELTYKVTNITKLTPTSSTFEINHHAYTIQIGGMYNIYNALAAYALGSFLGVTPDQIGKAFESDKKVFGRQEMIQVEDKQVTLILVKNLLASIKSLT